MTKLLDADIYKPVKEWQSLSDVEIEELYGDCSIEYFRDIEAKLRELNDDL